MLSRGVYFLANDHLLDLTIAFLNSFRKYNPAISLCLIPFDSNFSRIRKLQQKYHFSIYSNLENLERCDRISQSFHGQVNGMYRKLVCWEGDFSEFIYIDVDTLVLDSIDFAFKFLGSYDFVASHSDLPHLKEYVWKNSIDSVEYLTKQQIDYSANMGFFTSRKGAVRLDIVEKRLEAALLLSQHMTLRYGDQPFLNYLIVTSGMSYTSLSFLYYQKGCTKDIKLELWAGIKKFKISNGKLDAQGMYPEIFLLHWAGMWKPRSYWKNFLSFLKLIISQKESDRKIFRFRIPNYKIWKHYRYSRKMI